MRENELIGIAAVILLTLCLIALYQFIGNLGSHKKPASIEQSKQSESDRRLDVDPHGTLDSDDAWLLWSPEVDARPRPPSSGFGANRETNSSSEIR